MVDSGIILVKYWLEVGPDEQTRRLESRIDDPRKIWKLSDMDLKSYSRWYDYSRARDAMFAATDTAWAPWCVARHRRQEARSAQHDHPPARPDPVRAAAERERRRCPTRQKAGRLPGARPPAPTHPDAVLTERPAGCVVVGASSLSLGRTSEISAPSEVSETASLSENKVAKGARTLGRCAPSGNPLSPGRTVSRKSVGATLR